MIRDTVRAVGTVIFGRQLWLRWLRLSFRLRWHGQRLCVSVDHDELVLQAPDGAVHLTVDTDLVAVTPGESLRRPLRKRLPLLPAPAGWIRPARRWPPAGSDVNLPHRE